MLRKRLKDGEDGADEEELVENSKTKRLGKNEKELKISEMDSDDDDESNIDEKESSEDDDVPKKDKKTKSKKNNNILLIKKS